MQSTTQLLSMQSFLFFFSSSLLLSFIPSPHPSHTLPSPTLSLASLVLSLFSSSYDTSPSSPSSILIFLVPLPRQITPTHPLPRRLYESALSRSQSKYLHLSPSPASFSHHQIEHSLGKRNTKTKKVYLNKHPTQRKAKEKCHRAGEGSIYKSEPHLL